MKPKLEQYRNKAYFGIRYVIYEGSRHQSIWKHASLYCFFPVGIKSIGEIESFNHSKRFTQSVTTLESFNQINGHNIVGWLLFCLKWLRVKDRNIVAIQKYL